MLSRSVRGKGSLTLTSDATGLYYEFVAPKFASGIVESIERGDLLGSSFAFTVARNGDEFTKLADGRFLRIIKKFDQLFDVRVVARPAYPDTDVEVSE